MTAGQWRAHGRYVACESATFEQDPKGAGFDVSGPGIDISEKLAEWQGAGDPRLWKIILSPEFGDRVSLERLTRDVLKQMVKDVNSGMEWVAVAHHNTEHPHFQIALRGRADNGQPLDFSREYVKQGIRLHDICERGSQLLRSAFAAGVVESGFFPGVMLYLTFWYPRHRRARMVALFISANPLSGMFAGPVSGAILARTHGFARACVRGSWCSSSSGAICSRGNRHLTIPRRWSGAGRLARVRRAHRDRARSGTGGTRQATRGRFRTPLPRCLFQWEGLAAVPGVFWHPDGQLRLAFWLPQMLKDTLTGDPWLIGLLSTVPWGAAAIAMVIYAHYSDRTGERRWHVALGVGIAGLTLALGGLPAIIGWDWY
jgi:hypothetical protein